MTRPTRTLAGQGTLQGESDSFPVSYQMTISGPSTDPSGIAATSYVVSLSNLDSAALKHLQNRLIQNEPATLVLETGQRASLLVVSTNPPRVQMTGGLQDPAEPA